MLQALERNIGSIDERLVLLAPSAASAAGFFRNVDVDADRHEQLIQDVQRFRGRIYQQDGAIAADQLTADGRHLTADDDKSWHMLLLDKEQHLNACAQYREHDNTVALQDLRVQRIPLAQDEWRPKVLKAVADELARARKEHLGYVELGGWAVAPEVRRTSGPLTMALAVYGFGRRAGGALGMTTATYRHCSAVILQRLGGSRFEVDGTTLPPYYDPRYKCMMEILRFDSRTPNPKFIGLIDQLREKLADVLVITRPTVSLASQYETSAWSGQAIRPLFAA
jgi:hypothetical protein